MRPIRTLVRAGVLAAALASAALLAPVAAIASPGDPCADPQGHPGRTGQDGSCQLPYGPPPRQQPPR
ncbi:MAG: hypothetical protein ACRC20_10715 [Segniliparus sp.]|uniref:hypothetical protein n=1 Tax=Segniliparus sp. TaxID=2804064 RepID=UPI003F3CE9BE